MPLEYSAQLSRPRRRGRTTFGTSATESQPQLPQRRGCAITAAGDARDAVRRPVRCLVCDSAKKNDSTITVSKRTMKREQTFGVVLIIRRRFVRSCNVPSAPCDEPSLADAPLSCSCSGQGGSRSVTCCDMLGMHGGHIQSRGVARTYPSKSLRVMMPTTRFVWSQTGRVRKPSVRNAL